MNEKIPGIHHVTAIAGDPRRNLDFCTTVLGLRLVKVTVKYDDPSTEIRAGPPADRAEAAGERIPTTRP